MDQALLEMLEKKEYELITVKDVCQKAGVNRSTFYLHYEYMDDLLQESYGYVMGLFREKFNTDEMSSFDVANRPLNELILVNEKYLFPYLQFIKENKRIFKVIYERAELFQTASIYRELFERVLNPIMERFGSPKEDNEYMMEYYVHGCMALIMKWVGKGCKEDFEVIIKLLIKCVTCGNEGNVLSKQ